MSQRRIEAAKNAYYNKDPEASRRAHEKISLAGTGRRRSTPKSVANTSII
jgi:hypothetical protein